MTARILIALALLGGGCTTVPFPQEQCQERGIYCYELFIRPTAALDAATADRARAEAATGDGLDARNCALELLSHQDVAGSHREGVEWLRRALSREQDPRDTPEVLMILGKCHEVGRGVPRNEAEAFQHFSAAAEAEGFDEAPYKLGLLYEQGRGVPSDFTKAAYWFERAANEESFWACMKLAEYHEAGRPGVPRHLLKAAYWYWRACDYTASQFVEEYHQPSTRLRRLAPRLARLAEAGDVCAQFLLFLCCDDHYIFDDKAGAARWKSRLANPDYDEAKLARDLGFTTKE